MEEDFIETREEIAPSREDEAVLSAMVSVPRGGSRHAVVLVHGLFGSGTAKGVVPALAAALRARLVVCRVDLTGNGASGGAWRYSAYAREVADIDRAVRHLRAAHGAETCAVVGHSKGATDVLLYAGRAYSDSAKAPEEAPVLSVPPSCVFVTLAAKAYFDRGEPKFSAEELAACARDGAFDWAKFGRVWRITQADLDERRALHALLAAALTRIAPARVLALQGRADQFVTPDNADRIAALCPSAETVFLDDCGHYFRGFEDQMCDIVSSWIFKNVSFCP